MKNVQMPKWVAACLAISVLAALCLAGYALTSYTLLKPFTLTITTAPCPLTVDNLNFAYDPALNQYTSCTMQVSSTSASSLTATVYIYLKNSTQATIASGQLTQTFTPGSNALTVPLTWLPNENVGNLAGGYIVIQPL
ncbi:MAG: hypothetical protein ACPLZY_03490 [Candidatus Norongarragalinales archaeon]